MSMDGAHTDVVGDRSVVKECVDGDALVLGRDEESVRPPVAFSPLRLCQAHHRSTGARDGLCGWGKGRGSDGAKIRERERAREGRASVCAGETDKKTRLNARGTEVKV